MISKIWRWLKKLWFSLTEYYQANNLNNSEDWEENSSQRSSSSQGDHNHYSIKDHDLAFLFHQLLEGVVNGWQENRIEQFFERLEPRINIETWLDWLQKYRNQLLSSYAPNYQTAARMIILGEMTASMPFVRPVGDLAYQIGEELLNNNRDIEDNSLADSLRSHLPPREDLVSNHNNESQQLSSNSDDTFSPQSDYSLREVLHQLQNDHQFAIDTAHRLGIETDDPGIILEKLIKKSELSEQQSNKQENQANLAIDDDDRQKISENHSSETTPKHKISTTESTDHHPNSKYSSGYLDQWFKNGLEKAKQGDFEGAISEWDQLLEADATVAQAWHNKGSALAYLERFSEAIDSFDQAIALNVNDYESWNDRGNVLYNLDRWEEAIISWDRVIGIQPDYYLAWYRRGLALEKLRLWQEAIDSYQQCLEIKPNFIQAQNRLKKLEFSQML